jgi:alkanesulfonate monooxygenase SsuD/methylene tetrahydromethanopterin reductase-like flavin-dependent oxidoreductase (luciferase family)
MHVPPSRSVAGRFHGVLANAPSPDHVHTVFPSVDEARERARIVADAARAAGRQPLRFSIMTGCVVGRDRADVRDRLEALRATTGEHEEPPLCGTVDEVASRLRDYESAGVERAMLQHLVHEDVEMIAIIGDVAAELAR